MMKIRTRKPAASADNGKASHSDTDRHKYMAAQVAKNPPNDVESCPRLRASAGDWNGMVAERRGSFADTIAPIRDADEPASENRRAPRRSDRSRHRRIAGHRMKKRFRVA